MKSNVPSRNFSYYHQGEPAPRHYGLVLLAVALSSFLHVVLFRSVGDMRFSVAAPAGQDAGSRDYPAVHVDDLVQDPERPLDDPVAELRPDAPAAGARELVEQLARRPDLALTIPPVPDSIAAGRQISLLPVPDVKLDAGWQPRQDVAAVVDRLVRDNVATLPRRPLPPVERIEAAPDYVPPSDFTKNRLGADILPFRQARPAGPEVAPPQPCVPAGKEIREIAAATPPPTNQLPEETISRFAEPPGDISEFKPLDNRLMARMMAYRPKDGSGRVYFRLEIAVRDMRRLPVVPKDVVFVQDASRSLAEQRLYFCRKALHDAIRTVSPADRFNVVQFRDKTSFCFADWTRPGEASIAQADAFIDTMESTGDTDLFESLKSLLALPRDSRRPLIVVLVTDGRATAGLTESSDIIGRFSALNDNLSVFAIGTQPGANRYLLDLLAYCNRGASRVSKDRWSIPETIAAATESCSRPVLARIGIATDVASQADIVPLPSANLYEGRALDYYGSCSDQAGEIVLQVRGEGGDAKCDVMILLDMTKARPGGAYIKEGWARRKMLSLVGEYARTRLPGVLDEMRDLSKETGIPIPYRGLVGR